MEWEHLHRLADLIAILTLPTAVFGLGLIELARRMPRLRLRRGIGWSVIAVAAIFYGVDIADRFNAFAEQPPLDIALNWGAVPNAFFIEADSKAVAKYKEEQNLALILRVPLADIDPLTDTHIAKSMEYSITGKHQIFATQLPATITDRLGPGEYSLSLSIVMFPKKVGIERISSLGDVEKLGGKVVGTRGLGNVIQRVALPVRPSQ